jgi:hypothetical protein
MTWRQRRAAECVPVPATILDDGQNTFPAPGKADIDAIGTRSGGTDRLGRADDHGSIIGDAPPRAPPCRAGP